MSDTKKEPNPLFAVIGAVAPVLGSYTQDRIVQELWGRPGLAVRDRAIVTVTALVSRNATSAFTNYFNKALDSGLSPAEFSELLTHLAFYASWPYAFDAVGVLKGIFAERGVAADALPAVSPDLLPADAVLGGDPHGMASASAALAVPASPALLHFTQDLLLHEVWRRPGLAPRDRSLATVAALAALGQSALLPPYLNQALQHGVTKEELGEALAHIGFYAGWGNALQAACVSGQLPA